MPAPVMSTGGWIADRPFDLGSDRWSVAVRVEKFYQSEKLPKKSLPGLFVLIADDWLSSVSQEEKSLQEHEDNLDVLGSWCDGGPNQV